MLIRACPSPLSPLPDPLSPQGRGGRASARHGTMVGGEGRLSTHTRNDLVTGLTPAAVPSAGGSRIAGDRALGGGIDPGAGGARLGARRECDLVPVRAGGLRRLSRRPRPTCRPAPRFPHPAPGVGGRPGVDSHGCALRGPSLTSNICVTWGLPGQASALWTRRLPPPPKDAAAVSPDGLTYGCARSESPWSSFSSFASSSSKHFKSPVA